MACGSAFTGYVPAVRACCYEGRYGDGCGKQEDWHGTEELFHLYVKQQRRKSSMTSSLFLPSALDT